MTQLLRAALLCASMGLLMVALQIQFAVQVAIAGVFVMGMAGGLSLANAMVKPASRKETA